MKKLFMVVCLIVGMLICGNANADLNDGLVAYYPFNGNANDESSNENDGTVNGATLIKNRFGSADSAYSFDGVDDYIDVGDIDIIDTPISISSWINILGNNGEYRAIVAKRGSGSDYNYDLTILPMNEIYFAWSVGSSQNRIDTTSSLNNDRWYHVVLVYKNDGIAVPQIYVNGVETITDLYTGSNTSHLEESSANTLIGADFIGYPKEFFNGSIDDVRIYNRALSDSEIQQLYTMNDCVCPDSCSQSELNAQYEAGKKYCTDNPGACGLQPIDDPVCTDVITYGKVPNADCWVMFPTPCDVPEGWETTNSEPQDMCVKSSDNTTTPTDDGCAILEGNLDITMPCIDVFGNRLPIYLEKYVNPADPFGYYWMFNLE